MAESDMVNWIRCLTQSGRRRKTPDKLLTPILDYMSEQDRAAFLDLPQRLQDRPDREVMPKVLPDIEQERQAHTKRFSTPAKYRVACMQTVPNAFCCFYGLKIVMIYFMTLLIN